MIAPSRSLSPLHTLRSDRSITSFDEKRAIGTALSALTAPDASSSTRKGDE